jgi:hypothetical protein
MKADHFEFLVEEPSVQAFLAACLPRLFGTEVTFKIHVHQGKPDLLGKLESRLKAYAKWLPENARIVVLVDRDMSDCKVLKAKMDKAAAAAGLATRATSGGPTWRVVNRIAVEELEAWFFGEWNGVRRAYPKVASNTVHKAAFRQCDQITGGTWEAFERVMRKAGYFVGGLRKVEAADAIGSVFDPLDCSSPSFATFRGALLEATSDM